MLARVTLASILESLSLCRRTDTITSLVGVERVVCQFNLIVGQETGGAYTVANVGQEIAIIGQRWEWVRSVDGTRTWIRGDSRENLEQRVCVQEQQWARTSLRGSGSA